MKKIIISISLILLASCTAQENSKSVADDVLFLVLGKMSIYIQSPGGAHTLRDHHFVAEIMPKENGIILGGTLTSRDDKDFSLAFNPEGAQFLAHGARVMVPDALHDAHPDGTYLFSYQTKSGQMIDQPLTLKRRATTTSMPAPATLTLWQNERIIDAGNIDPDQDLKISWTVMNGNMKAPTSDLEDLIFVLGFDCFGKNIAHSGRPYQGTNYLTYKDSNFTVPADSLKPGINYSLIVEQATADAEIHQGVPGIATYATLTFLDAQTTGTAQGQSCPLK